MSLPLVTIIIPTFNRGELVLHALKSVINQTYRNWECIVVDDGSTDNSLEFLMEVQEKEKRINILSRTRFPKGAPTCRNLGINKAKGEYIIFLDSDDFLLPFCLENRIKKVISNKDYDFLVFPMGIKKNHEIHKCEIPRSTNYLIKFLSADLPWSIMCPIWKKSTLIKLGGFTEGYPRFNDPELMIRTLTKDSIKYAVFAESRFDCVNIPSPKANTNFNEKVYKGLFLLIPDTVQVLIEQQKYELRHFLVLFLHLWFKYIVDWNQPSQFVKSAKLITLFRQCNIITYQKEMELKIRLAINHFSNLYLKKPINKLTHKYIYLNVPAKKNYKSK